VIDVAIATTALTEDPDVPLLIAALAREGVRAVAAVWDDEQVDWSGFAATVIRSTWNYPVAYDEFLSWTRSVEGLINPCEVVAWNADKRYLDELAATGVPTIATTYAHHGDEAVFPDGDVVVKPTVGGGARGARRFAADELDAARSHVDALAALGRCAMVQPYVETVATIGETDVVVLDGTVSHAVMKHATVDLAVTARPTGPVSVERVEPSDRQRAVVTAALAAVPFDGPMCFARVDLLETDGGPTVMELELIEPFLFLEHAGAAADTLAGAIARRARS
jgi:glutathione synthase/RimK-type ligase-like ATP-grasp enzyme